MRLSTWTIAAAFIVAGAAGSAEAQTFGGNYPVCLQNFAPVQYIECRYDSIPQCQAAASGRAALCLENPNFGPESTPRRRRQR